MNNDDPVKSLYDTNVCHSRESGNPLFQILTSSWIPAFAGMTTIYVVINNQQNIMLSLPMQKKVISPVLLRSYKAPRLDPTLYLAEFPEAEVDLRGFPYSRIQ